MNNYTTASCVVAPELFIQTSYWKPTWTASRQLIKDAGHGCRARLREASILFSHAESRFLTLWDGEIRGTVGICSPPEPRGEEPSVVAAWSEGRCFDCVSSPLAPPSRPSDPWKRRAPPRRSNHLRRCRVTFLFCGINTRLVGVILTNSLAFFFLFAVKRFREPVGIRRPWRIWSEFIKFFSFSTSSCPTFLHFTRLHGWVKSVNVNKMWVEPFVFSGIDQTNQ